MSEGRGHPAAIRADMHKAVRLEWWNIAWSISYIAAVGLAMGSSQAMRTAWVEDMLGLIPPVAFLLAVRFERRPPNRHFHYGYDRANGLGFLVAAVALTAVGAMLLKDAAVSLFSQERVTVGSVVIFGHPIWLGWLMIGAQLYATIPPLIIGHLELPLARRLNDKLLHTDALMNKANWQTGVAGMVGVAGLGMGWWWADAAAAAFISVSIIADGIKSTRIAAVELLDGTPRKLDDEGMSDDARAIAAAIGKHYPDAKVLLRETGRFIRVEVVGAVPDKGRRECLAALDALDNAWRLDSISFRPDRKSRR